MKYSLRSLIRLAMWFAAINVLIALALSLSFQLIAPFPIALRAAVATVAFRAGGVLFLWLATCTSKKLSP